MKLLNFQLDGNLEAIEILSDGVSWDLHNLADFDGFDYEPRTGVLALHWIGSKGPDVADAGVLASVVDKTWSPPRFPFSLVFREVHFVRMQGASGELAESEMTLEGISSVRPGDQEPSLRLVLEGEEAFNLYFEFYSGSTLEVGAKSAEFVLEDRGGTEP